MVSLKFGTALLAFAACTAARVIQRDSGTFSHDPNAPDGFYIHVINKTGQPENIFVGTFIDVTTPPNNLTRRGQSDGSITCKNSYVLNYEDLVNAEQAFIQAFKNGASFSGYTTSYKSVSSVAYGCNYGNGQTITGTWVAGQFSSIAGSCGSSGPGWVAYPSWKASYGIDSSAVSFC